MSTETEPRSRLSDRLDAAISREGRGIEQHGIDYIPPAERHGKPLDLFWMWGGALWNIEYVVYGALVIAIGLSFWQAFAIIVLGNLTYLIAGLGSLPGPAAGTAVFTISRAPFGPRAARGISGFNWITQVGYEVEGLALIVLAGLALAAKAGVSASTGLKVLLVVLAALVQLVVPLFGHGAMMRFLRILVVPFVAVFVILAVLALPKAHFSGAPGASWEMMMVALALIATSGGFGWPINASDYSRYLPAGTSRRGIVWSVTIGGYVPSVLLSLLGAAVATAVPVASDPISGLPHAFASWFLVPYLILIIVQLFAINSIDLYSSGLTLQAIGLKIKRWQAVFIDTVFSGAITAVVIFSSSFNTFLTDFLLFMIIWIAPWVGIFLVDYFLRRGTYDSRSLLDVTKAGVYWRNGGVHVAGVVAQLVGMVAASMWLDTTVWQGPLSHATNGADFSIFMGSIFGGVVYFLLARRSVPSERVTEIGGVGSEPETAA